MSARQVVLDGGSPWGFRINGGSDVGSPLKISRVNPGSKAALRGIREGDVICSINGTPTKNIDNSTAHKLLRNAGEQLLLSLNEDGSSSPRRKLKQTITSSTISEHKTPSGDVITRKIVVRRYENGDKDGVTTEKVKAQVHAEGEESVAKESGLHLKRNKMPKKNKKPKTADEKNSSMETVITDVPGSKSEGECVPAANPDEKKGEKGFCLPLDKKLKMQLKRQKKKEKKKAFDMRGKELVAPETKLKTDVENIASLQAQDLNTSTNKENSESIDVPPLNPSTVNPIVDESVEKKLNVDNLITTTGLTSKDENLSKDGEIKYPVETIPEDLFEEFIENEEMVQVKETINTFPRTSPLHSPSFRRKQPEREIPAPAKSSSPPKLLYNYQGMSYTLSNGQPTTTDHDVVTEFENDQDACHNRKLDVIQEESSDFSDASGNSDKNRKMVTIRRKVHESDEKNTLKTSSGPSPKTVHPVPRPLAKMYPLYEDIKEEVSSSDTGGENDTQPITNETIVASKVDGEETGSNGHFKIDQCETSNGISDLLPLSGQRPEVPEKTDEDLNAMKDIGDQNEKSTWSMKSISSISTKLLEDESESWRSSIEPEMCGGSEADVESELDSQRACFVFDTCDEDLNFKVSDVRSPNRDDGIEIFIRNYKNKDLSDRDTIGSETYLEPSLNSVIRLSDVDCSLDAGLFQDEFSVSDREEYSKKLESFSSGANALLNPGIPMDQKLKGEEKTRPSVSVKKRLEAIKGDMDKILISKLRVIQSLDECNLSEMTWASVLENTKNQLEKRNLETNRTNESTANKKLVPDTRCYEEESNIEKISFPFRCKANTQNPEALSNLAEKKILTLPYGKLVLKKIGLGKCCSHESCSGSNHDVEDEMYVKSNARPNEQSFGLGSELSDLSVRSVPIGIWNRVRPHGENELSDSRSYIEFDYGDSRIGQTEKWYGAPTVVPAVLIGLSPSQKKIYEERCNKFMREEAEAADLLHLHQKFIERRSYNEPNLYTTYRHLKRNGTKAKEPVLVTKHGEFEANPGKQMNSSLGKKKPLDSREVKERRFASTTEQSSNKFGYSPDDPLETRSVGNSNIGDYLSKVNSQSKERDSKERIKGARKTVADEKSDQVVGKSCLLAILQNATSDNFVPELNKDSSIKSTIESHEVYSTHPTEDTMYNFWQSNPIFRYTPSCSVKEGETENLFGEKRQNFERIWNKERNMAIGDKKMSGKNRPKTICCEKETDVYAIEPIIEKKTATVKGTTIKHFKLNENEGLIITENLPAVSEVIRAFEEPTPRLDTFDHREESGRKRQLLIDSERYSISKRGDIAFLQPNGNDRRRNFPVEKRKSMPASLLSEKEVFNQKMYFEYMSKLAERLERRQNKVIRLSQSNEFEGLEHILKYPDIENEFIKKVKERREKIAGVPYGEKQTVLLDPLGMKCQEFTDYWKGETSNLENGKTVSAEEKDGGGTESSNSKRSSVQLILDTNSDVESLPKHLRELLQVEKEEFPDIFSDCSRFKLKAVDRSKLKYGKKNLLKEIDDSLVFSKGFLLKKGVWSPTQKVSIDKTEIKEESQERRKLEDEPIPPVWTPKSAQASPILEKKEFRPVNFESPVLSRKKYVQEERREASVPPPWQQPGGDRLPEIVKSPSSPALSLPKAPNPTVTLLQRAREGHLPRGAHYLNTKMNENPNLDGSIIERLEIVSSEKTDADRPRKVEVGGKKIIGIGPTTKEGIPLVLRSEVNEENKEKWYKRMYDSLHKAGNDDDYVTVKYRTSPSRKGLYGSQGYQYGSGSGYQSEPESLSYNLSSNKYVTLDRRRAEDAKEKQNESVREFRSRVSPPRRDFPGYKNQPGRIEDYEPGRCSISELETNKWWDEVLEIFDREEERSRPVRKEPSPRSFTNYASGYLSDPQYVYKRNEEEFQSPVTSEEQKEAYRIIQKGGEIPLKGLRKPAPERPKEDLDSEIEYFPISSTLTRIRVHKQNITPPSEFPYFSSPYLYEETTLNFPNFPFGVCSSYSQVQIFPPYPPITHYSNPELNSTNPCSSTSFLQAKKGQKFSVQLQNITGSNNYVRIVPKPRTTRTKSPIYANLPLNRSCSPIISEIEEKESGENIQSSENFPHPVEETEKVTETRAKKVAFSTFSDLKRTAPSLISTLGSQIILNNFDKDDNQDKRNSKKPASKLPKPTKSSDDFINKYATRNKKNSVVQSKPVKILKKEKKEITSDIKDRKNGKKLKRPLSESAHREKSLCRINKNLKVFSENLNKKKNENSKTSRGSIQLPGKQKGKTSTQVLFARKESEDVRKVKAQVSFAVNEKDEESKEGVAMTSTRENDDDDRPKIDADMTEVFRSRSFSPEVRRKIFKFPDMNKPVKKTSKTSPSLKMWAKMKVAYPVHKSRFDEFGSNIKFLQDKIKRKLKDVRDVKPEFGDDVETVRTVKRDENGEMSIKTNRYIKLTRLPPSGSLNLRSTYPAIDRRSLLPENRKRYASVEALKSSTRKSEHFKITKPATVACRKTSPKISDARSPGTASAGSSVKSETLDRKSVKVTTTASSKALPSRKAMGISSLKTTSSPCSSIRSYKSEGSYASVVYDKGTTSSQIRLVSPTSTGSRLSSGSGSSYCGSNLEKYGSDSRLSKPMTSKKVLKKSSSQELMTGKVVIKAKDKSKIPTLKRSLERSFISNKEESKIQNVDLRESKGLRKHEPLKTKRAVYKKPQEIVVKITGKEKEEENEIRKGRDLVRTDSFFQNLFLRGPIDRERTLETEKISSVLERARMYQRRINLTDTYKSEPSLSLVTFYLNQKRPVSFSKFKRRDRDSSSPRCRSPLGNLHSESFQMKLRRFDSLSQFGESLYRELSPEGRERSSSEPPLPRSTTNSPEGGNTWRISQSELSSRSSPNSSRSPSCRRIKSYKTASKSVESHRMNKKNASWTHSASQLEERTKLHGNFARSTSSLNLSNVSDHTEYQAYLLELMHSTRKCERFRELHKFYSNLERMEMLEKTASTGDLRPRFRSEEIIDFDRWKKIRTKERAEAELKVLVDNLMKVQKEKDLLFRASDIDAVRWKGDRGLRIKEKSVENLKDHFEECALKEADSDRWKKDLDLYKENYKSLWKENSINDIRGRLVAGREFEETRGRIGKEYGYSLKAWSSLSNEQINLLKDQLNEIYTQESMRKRVVSNADDDSERYAIVVPNETGIKSPGESVLQVRCNSALSKSQTYTPTVKRKENLRREWKKAESISALSSLAQDEKDDIFPSCLSPREEINLSKVSRSHSETRYSRESLHPAVSRPNSSRPLSEDEKRKLSMTLSREVAEKMANKGSPRGPVLPRETLGAVAAASTKIRDGNCPSSPLMANKERELDVFREELKSSREDICKTKRCNLISEIESGSGSSETSIKTVIRKNSTDVLKKVQYFEELRQNPDGTFESKYEEEFLSETEQDEKQKNSVTGAKREKNVHVIEMKKERVKKRATPVPSASLENLNDYFGHDKKYTSLPVSKPPKVDGLEAKNIFDENKWVPVRYSSTSPVAFKRLTDCGSNESLFSYRSRSVSPDPTKYYRAYLKMVKCGAVRKLCNKFESWEDLLSLSSDKDFWLPPAPRRFASDPELTRDLLRRFGTNPTKVTIRGQEVGDVKWLRTKFEENPNPGRGRSRFRRVRSPLVRSPMSSADRYMPRINVISKKAELQLQRTTGEQGKSEINTVPIRELPASPEGYTSLIDYTKDHGGYYFTGEVEKLRRKFEKLHDTQKLSILGQMYTSTPDVNELRDIAPYLECSWIAHRYPGGPKSPEPPVKKRETPKKSVCKPRPRSTSPARSKQPSSILKPTCPPASRSIFADQKFDPSIHRPKHRYQPEREVDRRYKRGDPDWWRHWNKPTVTFKETVSFKIDPEIRDMSPGRESPRKYVESEVTIHYKSPVRSEAKALLSEDELARRQAESMKRIYKEERRRKYLQELQDMNSRRHTDNFTPSQKSPIPLNRYDDFSAECNMYYATKGREYSVDPVLVARGLYDFVGRRPRELAFRRGDIIFIVRRLDRNWCEGELNGVVGLFPLSYVEVIPYNEINMKFGRAMAKYDFVPQTPLELAARKGDMITLLRKIDENWFEGRIGEKAGIIPASYCHILAVPQTGRAAVRSEKVSKPVAAPAAHSLIHNGSGLSSKHYYTPYLSSPTSPGRSTVSSASANYHDGSFSADMLIDEALMQLDEELDMKRSNVKSSVSQPLNVRVNPRPEPALYQVLFNHVPNNDDELELIQGETVTVVEKCGDGWYIGSKTSDGKLGIFPGTHVRRIASEFV